MTELRIRIRFHDPTLNSGGFVSWGAPDATEQAQALVDGKFNVEVVDRSETIRPIHPSQ